MPGRVPEAGTPPMTSSTVAGIDLMELAGWQSAADHLRARAKGFREAAFKQERRAGPLAAGFEYAADELESALRARSSLIEEERS